MERLLDPTNEDLGRRVAHATLVTRIFIVVAIGVGVACLIGLGYALSYLVDVGDDTNEIASGIEAQQQSNTEVVRRLEDLARDIDSCTNPRGDCARRGQEQQAKALGVIRADTAAVVAASLACQQRGAVGFENILRCATQTLEAQERPRG